MSKNTKLQRTSPHIVNNFSDPVFLKNKSKVWCQCFASSEAKPTTLKRPSPGDGSENHMYFIEACGSMKCNFRIRGHHIT